MTDETTKTASIIAILDNGHTVHIVFEDCWKADILFDLRSAVKRSDPFMQDDRIDAMTYLGVPIRELCTGRVVGIL